LQQIVKYSSNIGAVKVTEKIGPEVLYETLHDFGFGLKTGIDCPGETTGSVSHYRRGQNRYGGDRFGQGVSVSAIQLYNRGMRNRKRRNTDENPISSRRYRIRMGV
jgi:cell division protein FtsI (penicillin-binding protein 3)